MTQDGENQGHSAGGEKPGPARQPLAQLSTSKSQPPSDLDAHGHDLTALPESSTYEVAHPRDWILPPQPNKTEAEDVDWNEHQREMIEDLSFCVDINNSTILEDQVDEDVEVDVSDILGELGD